MVKQQGSLGFTLRKEDESVLGHYVRCLVREPATTDGRIKPGDKIVAVSMLPSVAEFINPVHITKRILLLSICVCVFVICLGQVKTDCSDSKQWACRTFIN